MSCEWWTRRALSSARHASAQRRLPCRPLPPMRTRRGGCLPRRPESPRLARVLAAADLAPEIFFVSSEPNARDRVFWVRTSASRPPHGLGRPNSASRQRVPRCRGWERARAREIWGWRAGERHWGRNSAAGASAKVTARPRPSTPPGHRLAHAPAPALACHNAHRSLEFGATIGEPKKNNARARPVAKQTGPGGCGAPGAGVRIKEKRSLRSRPGAVAGRWGSRGQSEDKFFFQHSTPVRSLPVFACGRVRLFVVSTASR